MSLRNLFRLVQRGWKQRVLTRIDIKRCVLNGFMPRIIVCKLHPWQPAIPIKMVWLDIGSEHLYNGPDGSLCLSV
eukprot:1070667-Pelagomonas_calceolata.AAC.1